MKKFRTLKTGIIIIIKKNIMRNRILNYDIIQPNFHSVLEKKIDSLPAIDRLLLREQLMAVLLGIEELKVEVGTTRFFYAKLCRTLPLSLHFFSPY